MKYYNNSQKYKKKKIKWNYVYEEIFFYSLYALKKVNLLKKTFRVVSNSFVAETWIATCTPYLQNY